MSRATFRKELTSDVAAGGTFTLSYFGGLTQSDFTDPQTVTIEVYARDFDCAISFGASEATVTWPAGAPYALPAGEYYIDVDTVGGDPLPADVSQATNVADLTDDSGGTSDGTIAAVTDTSATDQSAAINNNFADLAAKYNTLLANLRSAGLMDS